MTPELTDRQLEVLYLIAAGFTDRMIASVLQIRVTSVHTHVLRIRAALGASNRAHAVFLASRHNLFTERLAKGLARAR